MYQVWIWDDEVLEYVPERDESGGRIEFENWADAHNAAYERQKFDDRLRKVEYRSMRNKARRMG